MYFASFGDFIEMGGHGLYVWLAYSIALIILLFNVVSPILRKKQLMADYKRRLKREQLAAGRKPESAE